MTIRHSFERQVPGMNCQGCVANMRKAIQAQDAQADVTGTPTEKRLEIATTLDGDALDAVLREAGYPPGTPEEETAPTPAEPIEDVAAQSSPAIETRNTRTTTRRLSISGMTCASCVKSVREALERTPGVVGAEVNFGTHTAQVRGSADLDALVRAVQDVGYDAEPIVDMR